MSNLQHLFFVLRHIVGTGLVWVFLILISGCDAPAEGDSAQGSTQEEKKPTPLVAQGDGHWTLGPFTQGRLHLKMVSPIEEAGTITFFNAPGDSVEISSFEIASHLPKEDSCQLLMRWNTDAALLSFEHADTICFQRILPFRDNQGIAAFRIEKNLFQVDSISNESQIPDLPNVKIGYWGNALGPDKSKVASPWNARLAEMTHSQGVFLRMFGFNPAYEAQKPIGLSTKVNLELILSRQPDFFIISGGAFEQRIKGGAGIPAFRQTLTEVMSMATSSGTQPILLVLPPMPESASQQDKDLRLEYNNEMRSLAMSQGASVVDLWDRFRSRGVDPSTLQDESGVLTQAGHELIASELSTLLQYYLQFTQRQ